MQHQSQRLRITEKGWASYTGHFGGVEFKDGLSVELVDYATATRLGSIVRVTAVDTGMQAGSAANLQASMKNTAPVQAPAPTGLPSSTITPKAAPEPAYTREGLEAVADKDGIAGLRAIAEPKGIRGRGILELIDEILAWQEAN